MTIDLNDKRPLTLTDEAPLPLPSEFVLLALGISPEIENETMRYPNNDGRIMIKIYL